MGALKARSARGLGERSLHERSPDLAENWVTERDQFATDRKEAGGFFL